LALGPAVGIWSIRRLLVVQRIDFLAPQA